MSNVVAIREDITVDIQNQLAEAMLHANECDSVLILMEKRNGGMLYYANSNCTMMAMNWLLDRMKHVLHTILARAE